MVVTEIIEKANQSLAKLLAAIESLPAETHSIPKAIGEWSIKDILAHLIAWEEEASKALDIWKIGVDPDWNHIKDIDEFNAQAVKERRKVAFPKIIEQLRLVHGGIIDKLKSISDSEFSKRGGVPRWLANLIIDHLDEHTEKIIAFKEKFEPEMNAE
ncbi:MAG: ClbS/DfsB family four-helix bundle protein [candidate division Zixibacteria bacterium]|jgi:hypothetical protein|nr:ClbS/DfsB family four-helix bundle protein [candidate division Zixibacteria bacterium]